MAALRAASEEAEARVRAEVEATPLISPPQPIAAFIEGLADPAVRAAAAPLAGRYESVCNVRGDGSCFYRAALLALGTAFVRARGAAPCAAGVGGGGGGEGAPLQAAFAALLRRVEEAPALLGALSPRHDGIVADLMEPLADWVRGLGAPGATEGAAVAGALAAEDAYLVYGARLLCALELVEHQDRYVDAGGLVLGKPLEQFLQEDVEPTAAYADAVQVTAFAGALRARVRVEQLSHGGLHAAVLPLTGGEGVEVEIALLQFGTHYYALR